MLLHFFSQRARSFLFTFSAEVYRISAALKLPSFCNFSSSNDCPLQNSKRTESFNLLYPATGFPSKNQTGCLCHILFSASGNPLSISCASRSQISLSPGACESLYC